jgi:hypothetical protein
MTNALKGFTYAAAFFGMIASALFFTYLTVQFQYGLIEVAEWSPTLPITCQQFMTLVSAAAVLQSMIAAWGVLRMLDRKVRTA